MQTNNTAQNGQQMSLLQFGGIDEAISRVFTQAEVKNGKGAVVGVAVKVDSRKAIAERLNLKGKNNRDELDGAILEQRDAAWRKVRAEIAGLNGDWTMAKVQSRTLGNGIRQISLVVQEVKRGKVITDEQIAKAWGVPLEAVAEFRAKNARIGSPVDVEQVPAGPATAPAIPAKK